MDRSLRHHRRFFVAVAIAVAVGLSAAPGAAVTDGTMPPEYPVSDPVFGSATVNAAPPAVATIGGTSLVLWQELNTVVGARVTKSGVVLDPVGIAVAPAEGKSPDVASGGGRYLAVWSTSFGIQAARMSRAGKVMDRPPIHVRDAQILNPAVAVAFDGTNFLVVWSERADFITKEDLLGARVSPAGTVLDPTPIVVSAASDDQVAADLAFDGTNYLVVWQDYRAASYNVYSSRVAPDGTVLDPNGIPVSTAHLDQTEPAVAWNGSEYLVTWSDARSGFAKVDIYAARMMLDGTVLDPSGIAVSQALNEQTASSVDFDGTNFLAVWSDQRSHGAFAEVSAARVTPDGTVLDPAGILVAGEDLSYPDPAVVWNGRSHVVLWTTNGGVAHGYSGELVGGEVIARRVTSAGTVKDPSGITVSLGADSQYFPAMAFDGVNELVTWLDVRSPLIHAVYAGRVSPSGEILDGSGLQLSTGSSEYPVVDVAFDGTDYLVVWTKPFEGDSDLVGVRIAPDGTVLDPAPLLIFHVSGGVIVTPHVASNGTNWVVAWQVSYNADPTEVRAATVLGDGTVSQWLVVSTLDDSNTQVDIGTDGTGYLVAWTRYANPIVLGARLSAAGELLDPVAFTVSSAPDLKWSPSVSNGSSPYLVTWQDWRNFRHTLEDVYGARVSSEGTVLDPNGIAIGVSPDGEFSPTANWNGTNWMVAWENVSYPTLVTEVHLVRVAPDGTVLDDPPKVPATSPYPMEVAGSTSGPGAVAVIYQRLVAGPPFNAMRLFLRFIAE
jgi:hypothetical protein